MSVANVPGAADAADAAGAGGEPGCSGIRSPRAEAGRNGGVRVSDGAGSPISAAAATQRRPAVTGVDRHAAVFLPPGGEEGIRPGADAGADSAVRVSAAASGVTSAGEPRQPRDPREGGGGARGGVGRAGVLVRHNAAVLLHEPGPLIGRLLMPVILLLAMRPLYTAVQGPSGTALAVVGSLVTFSLLALSIVGSSILSERVWRTWDRLRQTPVRAGELLIGKALPVFGVLAAQQVFVLGFGVVAFGMRVAAPGLLVAACVAWILALLGMGSAAALLVRSYGQLMAAFDIGAFFLTTLGGVLVPLSTLPGWMRAAAPLSPGYWAADALREAAMGHAPRTYTDICVLLAIAAVTGTIAVRRVTRGWGRALAV
ncbi:ABC transporter permease [Streptomyces sp. NBC_00138]